MLPPDKVLPHLQAASSQLVIPYLEFLMERGEKEAVFHNELVFNYLDTILKLKQDPGYKSCTQTLRPPPLHTAHSSQLTAHDTSSISACCRCCCYYYSPSPSSSPANNTYLKTSGVRDRGKRARSARADAKEAHPLPRGLDLLRP
jgi:hypothetical protein